MEQTCPVCHQNVDATDFFCRNCGKKLHEPPLSTNIALEILYYIGSVLLPPFGLVWGIKYIKQPDPAARRIGIVSIVLTVVSLLVTILWTMQLIKGLTAQANTLLNGTNLQQNEFNGL